MFFAERIKGIKPGDKVLDIGPGSDPHPRADVLLELNVDAETLAAQRGYTSELKTDKKVVYYDGGEFPFADQEFDYTICSHVLEHVPNLEQFMGELFRVAPRGYVEYPLAYYDYLYNIDEHLNLLKFDSRHNTLVCLTKSQTNLNDFKPIQDFLLDSLRKGYDSLVIDLKPWLFEGFEWHKPFKLKRANDLVEVLPEGVKLPKKTFDHSAMSPAGAGDMEPANWLAKFLGGR